MDFDVKAKDWDADPVKIQRAAAVAQGIKAEIPLTSPIPALEYGCGTGLLSFALQSVLSHITLADSSAGMLAVLQEKIAAGGVRNMTPLKLDLVTDPLPPDKYHLIYTVMTLHHVMDTAKLLQAFYQLLASPGYLCIADLDKEDGSFHGTGFEGHPGFDRDELGDQARQQGFEDIRFTTIFQMPRKVQGAWREFPLFLMVAKKR